MKSRDIIKRNLLKKFVKFCTVQDKQPWILQRSIARKYGIDTCDMDYEEVQPESVKISQVNESLEAFDFISNL